MTFFFSLAAFKILKKNLPFELWHLCESLWIHIVRESLCLLYQEICFLSQVQEVFSPNHFLSLSFPSGIHITQTLVYLRSSQRFLELFYLFFKYLSFYSSNWLISIILSSRLLMFFCMSSVLLIPSGVFLISIIIFQLFLIFPSSLLKFCVNLFFSQVQLAFFLLLFWTL